MIYSEIFVQCEQPTPEINRIFLVVRPHNRIFAVMLQSLFISLPMIVCGVITIEMALEWMRRPDRAIRCLTVWAAVTTLLYSCHYIYFHHLFALLPFSDMVYVGCNLAVYPLYAIYISELTEARSLLSRKWCLLLILTPAVLGGIGSGMAYAMMSPSATRQFLDTYLYSRQHHGLTDWALVQATVHDISRVVFSAEVIVTMLWCAKKVRQYDRKLGQLYADTERRSLRWVNIVLLTLLAVSILSLVANEVGRSTFTNSPWVALPSLAFTSVIFAIGWLGIHHQAESSDIMRDLEITAQEGQPDEQEALPDQDTTPKETVDTPQEVEMPLIEKAIQLIEGQQLYLQYDLKLDDVATQLGTNRTYLIYALNEGKKMTFKEYINRLRIAYAKKLLAESPDMPKSEVASLCGYNTPSSFYRNWKKYESD